MLNMANRIWRLNWFIQFKRRLKFFEWSHSHISRKHFLDVECDLYVYIFRRIHQVKVFGFIHIPKVTNTDPTWTNLPLKLHLGVQDIYFIIWWPNVSCRTVAVWKILRQIRSWSIPIFFKELQFCSYPEVYMSTSLANIKLFCSFKVTVAFKNAY